MKKIASILVFMLFVQTSTTAFAQDGAKPDMDAIRTCMKNKTDEWMILNKSADATFEPTTQNRLTFNKNVVEIFERMYAVDRKWTVFIGLPISAAVGVLIYWIITQKTIRYAELRAARNNYKIAADAFEKSVAKLRVELATEQSLLVNIPKDLQAQMPLADYNIGQTNRVLAAQEKLTERELQGTASKVASNGYDNLIMKFRLRRLPFLLLVSGTLFLTMALNSNASAATHLNASLLQINASKTENDLYNYMEESEDGSTALFRSFFRENCNKFETKELFQITQLFSHATDKEIKQAIRKARKSKDLGLTTF